MAAKAILIFSGGLDSTTLLYKLIQDKNEVLTVSFDYGQRHKKELVYAEKICKNLAIKHKKIDITSIHTLLQGSSLTTPDIKIPEGNYTDESMKSTVVPNRNAIMLSIAY